MLALIVAMITSVEVNPAPSFDFLDIQWWQALGALLVALGLSPAPWLTMLATGRLLFRSDLDARLAERDRVHTAAMAAKEVSHQAILDERERRYDDQKRTSDNNAVAAETERRRADALAEGVLEVVDVMKAANHYMAAVDEVAREAQSDG